MDKSFFIRCNQFRDISKKYYQKYCEEKERHTFLVEYQFLYENDAEWIMEMFGNSERRDEYAIIAIVSVKGLIKHTDSYQLLGS